MTQKDYEFIVKIVYNLRWLEIVTPRQAASIIEEFAAQLAVNPKFDRKKFLTQYTKLVEGKK